MRLQCESRSSFSTGLHSQIAALFIGLFKRLLISLVSSVRLTSLLSSYIKKLVSLQSLSGGVAKMRAFYPRDAMLTRSLRQRRVCLSVRLSVRHTPVLCLAERKEDREMYTV